MNDVRLHELIYGRMHGRHGNTHGSHGGFMASMLAPIPPTSGWFGAPMGSYNIPNTTNIFNEEWRR
jgi:hypothetical protein